MKIKCVNVTANVKYVNAKEKKTMLKYEYKVSRLPHQRRKQTKKPSGYVSSYGYVGKRNGKQILFATENEYLESL